MSTWTPTWSPCAQEEYNSPDLYTSRSAAVSVSPMTSTKRLCSVVSLSAVVPPGDEPAGAVLLACRRSFTDPPQIARHRDTVAKCHPQEAPAPQARKSVVLGQGETVRGDI